MLLVDNIIMYNQHNIIYIILAIWILMEHAVLEP